MSMRTHVEFRSSKFPLDPDDDEDEVNSGVWGKRLAKYLQERLAERSIDTGDVFGEDWEWVVPLRHDAFRMWIGCANYGEEDDGYLVFIEPSRPTIRKGLFRKIDTTADVAKVADAIDAILTSDPEIRGVRWWAEGER